MSAQFLNSLLRTKHYRILYLLWCLSEILYHSQRNRRISGSSRHCRYHAQRSYVSNDAFDLHSPDEISSITTVHWTGWALHYCRQPNHVILRYPSLAAHRKPGRPLRYCKFIEKKFHSSFSRNTNAINSPGLPFFKQLLISRDLGLRAPLFTYNPLLRRMVHCPERNGLWNNVGRQVGSRSGHAVHHVCTPR